MEVFGSGDLLGLIEMGIWTWMQQGVDGIVVGRGPGVVIQDVRRRQQAGHQRWM